MTEKTKNNLNNNEVFVKHLIGTSSMLSWISQWEVMEFFDKKNDAGLLFNFNKIMSQRFFLGFPLNLAKHGKLPFIAFQSLEYSWVNMIQWRKVLICKNNNRMYLISNKIKTIYGDHLPSFAISIEFLDGRVFDKLKKYNNIAFKNLWFEDEIDESIDKTDDLSQGVLSPLSDDIIVSLSFIEDESEVLIKSENNNKLSGKLDILDRLRAGLAIDKKIEQNSTKFIGKGNYSFDEETAKFLKSFINEAKNDKPKIRIRND